MGDRKDDKLQGTQKQDSRQSARQGPDGSAHGSAAPKSGSRAGIGSSQGQDAERREEQRRERPSAGTADIERGASQDTRGQDSLVQDPTGAFKERP